MKAATSTPVCFTGKVLLEDPQNVLPIILDGKDITDRLWALAGAFDDSTIVVSIEESVTAWGPCDAIVLRAYHEYLERPMQREILLLSDAEPAISLMHNVEFYLKRSMRQQGIGAFSLATEAVAALELGFTRIVANAANHPDVGCIVWPKLGYDAVVEPDILRKMQPALDAIGMVYRPGQLRISQLWDSGHFDLWEKYGAGCIMEFDVSRDDSWSMRRITAVIETWGK